jgi:hypothetical protein
MWNLQFSLQQECEYQDRQNNASSNASSEMEELIPKQLVNVKPNKFIIWKISASKIVLGLEVCL